MNKTKDIAKIFVNALEHKQFVSDKTGCKTIEIIGANFIADKPSIFGEPNADYIDHELYWYESQSSNINDIYQGRKDPPQAWQYSANQHGEINSNYGLLIYNPKYYNQFEQVVQELRNNPYSRRGTMVYNRPSIWEEYNENGKNDFICTNAVTYYIRGGVELTGVVQMRSNDVVFGYKNDYAWQKYVQYELAQELDLDIGPLHWQVQNLHVYERHFDLVK